MDSVTRNLTNDLVLTASKQGLVITVDQQLTKRNEQSK